MMGMSYHKVLFPEMAATLAEVKRLIETGTADDRGAVKAALSRVRAEAEDSLVAVLTTVTCNDGPVDRRPSVSDPQVAGVPRPRPDTGRFLDRPPGLRVLEEQKVPPTAHNGRKGCPPVLMVQSAHDPGTPIEGARNAHAKFGNSRMLTITDEGDHGIYAFGNANVDKIVNAYLVDGVVPQDQRARHAIAGPCSVITRPADSGNTQSQRAFL